MKILECKRIDTQNYDNITYIRIEPEDISVTLRDIISSLSDMSWISRFDKTYVRNCFFKRADESAKYLADKIQKNIDDVITKDSRNNAYGVGMEQVDRFIREGQDLSDLNDIDKFFEDKSLDYANNGDKAYAIAVASKGTSFETIIKGIVSNSHYINIAENKEVLYLAVNI